MAEPPITCDDCGFDAARWTPTDLERTLAHADDLVAFVTHGWADAPEVAIDPTGGPPAATHALMHRLDALAVERRLAEPYEPMAGTVSGIHASDGGVPKRPIRAATVDASGIVGDRQGTRRHHGRPWQALCLYSAEVIDALASEGHPIAPGAIGENLTIAGVDWTRLRGGLTVEIGEVRLRLSSPAAPCTKIGESFSGGAFDRVDHITRPGWARWYASVLTGGPIAPGDPVAIHA